MKILKLLFLCIVFVGTSCTQNYLEPDVSETFYIYNNSTDTIIVILKASEYNYSPDSVSIKPNFDYYPSPIKLSNKWLSKSEFNDFIKNFEITVINNNEATQHHKESIANIEKWEKDQNIYHYNLTKVNSIRYRFTFQPYIK